MRQWALFLVSLTSCVEPYLTIVASGLLSSQTVSDSRTGTVTQVDWINSSQVHHWPSTDGSADIFSASLIELQQSYPLWTQGELALGQVSIPHTMSQEANFLDVFIPAMRASLSCQSHTRGAPRGFNVSNWFTSDSLPGANNIMAEVSIPAGCPQWTYYADGNTDQENHTKSVGLRLALHSNPGMREPATLEGFSRPPMIHLMTTSRPRALGSLLSLVT